MKKETMYFIEANLVGIIFGLWLNDFGAGCFMIGLLLILGRWKTLE